QINQAGRELTVVFDPFRRFGNPTRGRVRRSPGRIDARQRTPETGKRKFAEIPLDLVPDRSGLRVDVEYLSSIGRIHGARSDGIIRAGIHIVPPEKLCAGELWIALAQFLPQLASLHEVVGLFPELD